jgi:hypothetical protein
MSRRRDDITGAVRAQIAVQCLAAGPEQAAVRQALLAQYDLTRQSLYNITQRARAGLAELLAPPGHGPMAAVRPIQVTPEHVLRSLLVLADSGVSERKMQSCLTEILGCTPSLGWISGQLQRLGQRAAQVNASWQPALGEGLAADEIFCQARPNLVVVGSESLYIYALTQQDQRDGETWACVLWDTPVTGQLARDGGTGLHLGAQLTQRPEQLDWWHVLRDVWRIQSSLERRAYGALSQLFEREWLFDQAHTAKRLAQHWQQWQHLNQQAEVALAAHDRYYRLAQAVDDLFAMIDLTTGGVVDAATICARLQQLGQQIFALGGRACQTLGTTLQTQAPWLFAYVPRLQQALQPLQCQWGPAAIAALGRLWQVEQTSRRRALSLAERQQFNALWQASFETAAQLLDDDLFEAWEDVQALLSRNWRGSNAAECVNSLLRPHFNARKSTNQAALELRRFLHNTHTFTRGKRAGHAPAQLVGIDLPADPWTLLGLPERTSM